MRHRHLAQLRRPGGVVALLLVALCALSGCGAADAGPHLALTAALPDRVPAKTVLRVGDPATQVVLHDSGLDKNLPFKIEWANISGGPKSLQAFRARALDVSSVADIPPLFATWTGTDVRIIAARTTQDPLQHPLYALGVAPGEHITTLADLKGKKIAYSAGQAQGALVLKVLKKAGLSQKDVKLVNLASTDDSYVNVLGSKQVDVAPIGQALQKEYLLKYGKDGASTVATGIRDDAWTLYAPTDVVENAAKAAALKEYVALWAKATVWINEHPARFAEDYYVKTQGLSLADAKSVVAEQGTYVVPANWNQIIKDHQATADLLEKDQGQKHLDVADLYDRRFEKLGHDAIAGGAK